MTSFKNADAGVIVDQLIKTIQKERDYLSEIDGKIGDGDHGINMNKGFTMCEKKLEGTTYNLSEGLTTLGETLLEDIGGSMGPLYGMLFDEMAQACEDEEEITADVFAEMITASVEGIQDISPAQVGRDEHPSRREGYRIPRGDLLHPQLLHRQRPRPRFRHLQHLQRPRW